MNEYTISGGAVAIFIALYIFYSSNKRRRLKREERQEKLAERQDELLRVLRKKSGNVQNPEVSDTTGDATKNESR